MKSPLPSIAAALCALFVLSHPLRAEDFSWSSTPSDGWWSTAANWTPSTATAPGGSDTALLGNVTADRSAIYDDQAAGSLTTLTFAQTSAFTNSLEVRRTLTLADALTLSASNGGTSRLFINTAGVADATDRFAGLNATDGSPVVTASAGITIGSGGVLEFGRKADANSGGLTYVTGPVVIDGGTLAIQRAVKPSSGGPSSFFYQINGPLTLSSGNLTLFSDSTNTDAGYTPFDSRVRVYGNFTATGGTINTQSYGYGNNLYLDGASNSISSQVVIQGNIGILLTTNANQTLSSDVQFHRLVLNGSGVKTIGADVDLLEFSPAYGSTLKLARDITVATSFTTSVSNTNRELAIDTNGHTLDASTATFSLGGGAGNATATWNIGGDGVLKAKSFNLATGAATNVSGATTLMATAAGSANNLGNVSGTISADSIFAYAAGSGSDASTLESNRAIGRLRVDSGTLALAGSADISATSVTVKAGATLDVSARAFTTTGNSITLGIAGGTFGRIVTGGSFAADGSTTLTLDFGAMPAVAGTYNLFGDGATLSGTFSSVTMTGLYSGVVLDASNSWTGSADGLVFTFNTASGSLGITGAAIPEPGFLSVIAGLGAMLFTVVSRCRRR